MIPICNDAPLLEHEHAVCDGDCAVAVRNDERRPPLHQRG
jgi:hypothetical protein